MAMSIRELLALQEDMQLANREKVEQWILEGRTDVSPNGGRADPGQQEPLRAEHRREEAPAAGHVLARQPPSHQRALPAEHTGGEGMSYNPYTAQERHRRAQPRREAIRGADMARCAVITFAAVLMLLGAWILM